MSRPILSTCLAGCLALLSMLPASLHARVAQARIARIDTAVASLEQVRVRLDWAAGADTGNLEIRAARVDAADLGYRYRDLLWQCPLRRAANGGWSCEGMVRAGNGAPVRLAVHFDAANTRASLAHEQARLALDRSAASPDLTGIDLAQVPVAWAQALLAQTWPAATLAAGRLDGRLVIAAPAGKPLRVTGPLRLRGLGLETADASIAAQGVDADLRIDYRGSASARQVEVEGELRGGELLAGNTYVALPAHPVGLTVEATRHGDAGWRLPYFQWRDGEALQASGSAAFDVDFKLRMLDLAARSGDMAPLRPRYLSGWLGLLGLGELDMRGAVDLRVQVREGVLSAVDARLHGVSLGDPRERFVFDDLQGDVRYSADAPVRSALRWGGGKLYGLPFDAAQLRFDSRHGALRVRGDADVPLMGGVMSFRNVEIRPPAGEAGTVIRFGLELDDIDFGQVSRALGLPAFQGRLSGSIPNARYANERVDFDGGLSMRLFEGRVAFSALSLERPFGSAPSLSADIAFDDLDLLRLTEVLGFGSISGRLDGRIEGLRLVDWTPVAFDARFITDDAPGTKRRISQRAVQNIGSVGDASFVSSLQGQLIGLFDDFGYRRIGIGCRLANEVCAMSGLRHSDGSQAGNAFTIVEGAGIPRLTVVGFNRQVDWPTLVERLAAVGSGEVKPVVD